VADPGQPGVALLSIDGVGAAEAAGEVPGEEGAEGPMPGGRLGRILLEGEGLAVGLSDARLELRDGDAGVEERVGAHPVEEAPAEGPVGSGRGELIGRFEVEVEGRTAAEGAIGKGSREAAGVHVVRDALEGGEHRVEALGRVLAMDGEWVRP